ncbi:hypothetical protein BH688_04250 [Kushneria phosphatilytica]|nr:hypothetical protein BH688_04250 [Kushneria phosphatilytica]
MVTSCFELTKRSSLLSVSDVMEWRSHDDGMSVASCRENAMRMLLTGIGTGVIRIFHISALMHYVHALIRLTTYD